MESVNDDLMYVKKMLRLYNNDNNKAYIYGSLRIRQKEIFWLMNQADQHIWKCCRYSDWVTEDFFH